MGLQLKMSLVCVEAHPCAHSITWLWKSLPLSGQSAAIVTTSVGFRLFSNLTLLSLYCWFFRRIEFNLSAADWTIYLSKHTTSSFKSLTFLSPDACSKGGLLSSSKVLLKSKGFAHSLHLFHHGYSHLLWTVGHTTFTATKGHACYGLFYGIFMYRSSYWPNQNLHQTVHRNSCY